jgi:hypothetical protein
MTEAPKPVFVLIGIVALVVMAAAAYVGWQAEMSAMAGETHAEAPAT